MGVALCVVAACGGAPEGEDPADAPRISGIEVADNPNNVLSRIVRWTTDVPATSRVEFGTTEGYTHFVGDDTLVTEHELLVIGLRPQSEAHLAVVSGSDAGIDARSEDLVTHVAPFPYDVVEYALTAHDADRSQPGWTLTNSILSTSWSPAVALMLDAEGVPVWYHAISDEVARGDVEVSLLDGDRVLIGGGIGGGQRPVEVDLGGNVMWEGPVQPDDIGAPGGHHHCFAKLVAGGYVTLAYEEGDGHLADAVVELDASGETVWSWSAQAHVPQQSDGYVWGNMAMIRDGAAYYHAHDIDSLYRIDRAGGEVDWVLSPQGDFEPIGDHPQPWFQHAHAPELLPDGHLLVYDNGTQERGYSRAIEYELDEDAMTVAVVWEYPGDLADDPWQTTVWGDVDRLENGNTLINAGTRHDEEGPSRIFEVTPDGEVVWEIEGELDGEPAGSYMAERIPVLVGVLQ